MAVAICFTIISGHGTLQHVTNIAVFTRSATKAGFTLGA